MPPLARADPTLVDCELMCGAPDLGVNRVSADWGNASRLAESSPTGPVIPSQSSGGELKEVALWPIPDSPPTNISSMIGDLGQGSDYKS
ncbi:hypothetical protein Nepgr_007950 [Nepenthes gracilis]|uniref:Uncharacterized protein n=1 Tax=Nepenthes gracilis TaxID=150966 RepID=A0AAD3S7X4_NEPGR|nr:hypothetical protein Nepgr_007950 [Nepenthes gracilis]